LGLDPETTWSLEEMLDILAPRYFFGFLTNDEVKLLMKVPHTSIGTFLFRFSSETNFFALSALLSNSETGHWRITKTKALGKMTLVMQGIGFDSFQAIVDYFSLHPLTKGGAVLTSPCDRNLLVNHNQYNT